MTFRTTTLIADLGLKPHPEGGHFREVFRSPREVSPADERPSRSALTSIYFLLGAGDASHWHRVGSDEAWHFLEGDPLDLFEIDTEAGTLHVTTLGPHSAGQQPLHVVAAGRWQAARPHGAYALVACTVGPGFEFADFEMLRDLPEAAAAVARDHPGVADLV
ncbi:MAG: cupin domain-containing protein [Bacteroidota bacterium]